ncbi:LuxR C-terminal-related transcriptional regulator [Streptomyces sp. NPDC057411]|uniref:LuxR C-terminal-related transcriptional regulator n=1 Tax=unclassified Streptomyces TaxID=2593676 RepID=UPI003635535C
MTMVIGATTGAAQRRAQQGAGRSPLLKVARLSEQELIEAEACNPFDSAAGHQRLFREDAAVLDSRRYELRLTPLSNPAGNDSPANSPWIAARVLLAGGHPIALAGLRSVLDSAQGEGLRVVGAVRDQWQALREMPRYRPDVVLLGASESLHKDLATVRSLRRSKGVAEARIVLLRKPESASQVTRMLRAGVSGAFPLDQDPSCVVRAISVVAAGGSIFLPAPLEDDGFADGPHPAEDPNELPVDEAELTDRERAVLAQLARGLSNAEIGRELSLSVATVKKYMTGAMRKIRQPDRLKAALYALRQGLA